ncbi:hypothetical protein NDU88_001409 [Pleurodeles waltl]|uniref:Uncharacterized protein n=1 Tax=Pleurodeles waltl TaxID=8319 RepID=A0AAV7L9E1_PLEWA|nr:hypothetical protein NDU88_001409 [Pleurodeles waltl]
MKSGRQRVTKQQIGGGDQQATEEKITEGLELLSGDTVEGGKIRSPGAAASIIYRRGAVGSLRTGASAAGKKASADAGKRWNVGRAVKRQEGRGAAREL